MSNIHNIFTRIQGTVDTNSQIMTAILDNNLANLKLLVNKSNVNNQINSNGDTCVILSCRLNRQHILNYLLNNLDAKFNIKNKENEDSFDVGTEKTKRILFDHKDKISNLELDAIYDKLDSKTVELKSVKEELNFVQKNYDIISKNNTKLNEKIKNLENERDLLLNRCEELLKKNTTFEIDLIKEKKKVENEKRKATESENAYLNLKKSKR